MLKIKKRGKTHGRIFNICTTLWITDSISYNSIAVITMLYSAYGNQKAHNLN